MKKVRLDFAVLLAFIFLFVACDQEGFYEDDFNDYGDEWYDDGGDHDSDHDDGHGHSHSDGETILLTSYRINGDQITKIEDHQVSEDFLPYQQDEGTHFKMWEYYTTLIPAQYRNYITEFVVFHGQNDVAGYVEPIDENNLGAWRMALSIDAIGNLNQVDITEDFAYLIVHEYAHVLTLNTTQVDVGGSENSCPNFHTGEGCSKQGSYINQLFELGWADIYEEYLDYGDNLDAFYNKYRDRFVTDYAATNPGEDIAEVFSVFVVENNYPSGNQIKDQKVKLMYEFPELVTMRDQIRNENPVLRTMQAGSWVQKGMRKVRTR